MRAHTGLLGILALVAFTGFAPVDAGAAYRRAVAVFGREMRGVIVYHRHVDFDMRIGPTTRQDRNDAEIIVVDGLYERLRFVAMARSGKPLSAKDMAGEERDANEELRLGHGFFKEPYDPRYAEEYRVTAGKCDGCAGGVAAVAFESDTRDAQHGFGTMQIDGAGHVLTETYTPYVLHEHANTASIVETSDEAIPGLWAVNHTEERYKGRVAMIPGSAVLQTVRDRYRRFARLDEAIEAVTAAK
jgi:hypothetical protein